MSQTMRMYELIKDGQPHRTDQICRVVYGDEHLGVARISARIYDLKVEKGLEIISWKDPIKKTLHWYQVKNTPENAKNSDLRQDDSQNKEFIPISIKNNQQAPELKPSKEIEDNQKGNNTIFGITLRQIALF